MPLKTVEKPAVLEEIHLFCVATITDKMTIRQIPSVQVQDYNCEFALNATTFNGGRSEEIDDDVPDNMIFNQVLTRADLRAFGEACIRLADGN